MNDVNRKCLEKILNHITHLICLVEYEDIKAMQKYVDMATSVSAQLMAIDEKDIVVNKEDIK